jgi:hypothetical protein
VQLLQITCTRHTHKHPTTSKVVTTFILLIRLSTSTARPQSSSSTPGHSTLRTKSSKSACNEEGMENAARAQICEHRTTTGSASGVPGACAIAARPAGVHGAEVAANITEADLRGEQPGESRSSNAVGMSGIGLLEPHVCTTKLCAHMIHAHAHACLATCALPLGSWPPPLKDTDIFPRIHSTLWSACQQESASHKHTCEESNRWTPRSNHWIRSNRWSQANHWRNLSQQRMQDRQGLGKTNRWTCPRIQSLDPPILQPLQSLETPATSESAKTPITGVCTQKHQSQVYAAANHRQLPRRAVSRHAQVHGRLLNKTK